MNMPWLIRWSWMVLATCAAASCSGGSEPPSGNDAPDDNGQKPVAVSMALLLDCSVSGISYSASADKLIVSFSSLPPGGQFIRISLPAGFSAADYAWAGEATTAATPVVLTLAVPTPDGLELGVVPLETYTNQQLSFFASLGQAEAAVSSVPSGSENTLDDLAVVPLSLNTVRISWTQRNAGDYNFDGRVDLADLRVVAENYGQGIDRLAQSAVDETIFWVDGNCDGLIDASDINTILEHYGAVLAGYNVRKNGQLQSTETSAGPTLAISAAKLRTGLPPRYELELTGTTMDTWTVNAVGADGTEGAGGSTDPYAADLLVSVNINGIPLDNISGEMPGFNPPIKWGTRVIDPGEIIGRPTLAKPQSVTANTGTYRGLPKGKLLLLDIRYLPRVDLATGAPRSTSGKQMRTLDDVSNLQITAVPFMLIEGSNMLEIHAEIELQQRDDSSYFVDLQTTTIIPGQPELKGQSRLSYVDGVLVSDSDINGSYADEAQFLDDDRDQVSNQRIEFVQDNSSAPGEPQLLALQGELGTYDPASAYLTLENPVVVSGEADLPGSLTPLFMTEDTVFVSELDPNHWLMGDHISLDALVLTDTRDGAQPVYWVQRAEQLPGPLISAGWLAASNDQPWQIEVSWHILDEFGSYYIERSEYLPGYGFVVTAEPRTFLATDAPGYVDYEVVPHVEYRYKYYGIQANGELVLLGEDVGQATSDGDPGGGRFFAGTLDWISFDELAISSGEQQWHFYYDFMTIWIGVDPGATGPYDFHAGDPVEVLAYEDLYGWYAFQVAKAGPAPNTL